MPSEEERSAASELEKAMSELEAILARSLSAVSELVTVCGEIRPRRLRLREALRGGEADVAVLRRRIDRFVASVGGEGADAAAAIHAARFHRRVLDRAASAIGSRDPLRAPVRRAQRRADRAKARLVATASSVAAAVARRYRRPGVDVSDLVQEATLGLLHAADKFDAARGHRFATYAAFWARQHVARALVEHARLIRVPLHVLEENRRLQRGARLFAMRHGREPRPGEVAGSPRARPATIDAARDLVREPISLHAPSGGDADRAIIELLADTANAPPDEQLAAARLRTLILASLASLSAREQSVLRLRFGIDGREHTLQEIGNRFGCTRERIRRIEARALRKLQASKDRPLLASFLAA